jgi:hypothetical protein
MAVLASLQRLAPRTGAMIGHSAGDRLGVGQQTRRHLQLAPKHRAKIPFIRGFLRAAFH